MWRSISFLHWLLYYMTSDNTNDTWNEITKYNSLECTWSGSFSSSRPDVSKTGWTVGSILITSWWNAVSNPRRLTQKQVADLYSLLQFHIVKFLPLGINFTFANFFRIFHNSKVIPSSRKFNNFQWQYKYTLSVSIINALKIIYINRDQRAKN